MPSIKKYYPLVFLIFVSLSALFPMIFSGKKINLNDDFLKHATNHCLFRQNVLEHGQFPLRSQYLGGGYPAIADPDNPFLSPLVLITLIFGEIFGLKIIIAVIFIAGVVSMYFFARKIMKYNESGALYSALLTGFSSWYLMRVDSGNINELYMFLCPLVIILYEKYLKDSKYLFVLSLLLAAITMDGKYCVAVLVFFVFMYSFLRGNENSGNKKIDFGWMKYFLLLITAVFMLSAVKILPFIELMSLKKQITIDVIDTHPGGYEQTNGYTLAELSDILLNEKETTYSAYVGILPFILFLSGAYLLRKKLYLWVVVFILFCVLSMGNNSPVDLFRALKNLPVFGYMDKPFKYFNFFIVFIISIAGGGFFEYIHEKFSNYRKIAIAVSAILIAVSIAPLFAFAFNHYAGIFKIDFGKVKNYSNDGFSQALIVNQELNNPFMYFNAKQGIGTINWYGAIKLKEKAMPKYFSDYYIENGNIKVKFHPNSEYKGEAYFLNNANKVKKVQMSANKIVVETECNLCPDTLIINQNFDRRWVLKNGYIASENGLISIKVSSLENNYFELKYKPLWFYIGFLISLITFILLILFTFKKTLDKNAILHYTFIEKMNHAA